MQHQPAKPEAKRLMHNGSSRTNGSLTSLAASTVSARAAAPPVQEPSQHDTTDCELSPAKLVRPQYDTADAELLSAALTTTMASESHAQKPPQQEAADVDLSPMGLPHAAEAGAGRLPEAAVAESDRPDAADIERSPPRLPIDAAGRILVPGPRHGRYWMFSRCARSSERAAVLLTLLSCAPWVLFCLPSSRQHFFLSNAQSAMMLVSQSLVVLSAAWFSAATGGDPRNRPVVTHLLITAAYAVIIANGLTDFGWSSSARLVAQVFYFAAFALLIGVAWCRFRLIRQHVRHLQVSMQLIKGILAFNVTAVVVDLVLSDCLRISHPLLYAVRYIRTLFWFVMLVLFIFGGAAAVSKLRGIRLVTDGRTAAEALASERLLWQQMEWIAISGVLGVSLAGMIYFLKEMHGVNMTDDLACLRADKFYAFRWAFAATCIVDMLGNTLAALHFAGSFGGALSTARVRHKHELAVQERRLASARTWHIHKDAQWQDKVLELAGRGITLEVLLDFYGGLPAGPMPHFDPEKHTTADVVRLAIIPGSSSRQCSLAQLMMSGRPTRPQAMVTHNWGNLFRDLVAAVCAHALCDAEYQMIAYLLDSDIDCLRGFLVSAGVMEKTYWICAFGVNQHAIICGFNPGDADPVTKQVHPVCRCGLPKVKEGIGCEVNKFHDMMELLAASDPDFQQVVAIDAEFQLFTHAWCVAELAAASTTGMKQALKMRSSDTLLVHQDRLRSLRIKNMSASRPEDVEEILQRIPDVTKFDANLQHMLFDDLLPAWSTMDADKRMERIGHLLFWVKVAKSRKSTGVWQKASVRSSSSKRIRDTE